MLKSVIELLLSRLIAGLAVTMVCLMVLVSTAHGRVISGVMGAFLWEGLCQNALQSAVLLAAPSRTTIFPHKSKLTAPSNNPWEHAMLDVGYLHVSDSAGSQCFIVISLHF